MYRPDKTTVKPAKTYRIPKQYQGMRGLTNKLAASKLKQFTPKKIK